MFLDLKQYWGLDLVAFLGGEVLSSVQVISAYIRHLPEESRFVSRWRSENPEQADAIELTAAQQKMMDARVWNDQNQLLAMIANAINNNTTLTGQWEKGKSPDFPVVGPLAWDEKRSKRLDIKERVNKGQFTTAEILKAMGKHG